MTKYKIQYSKAVDGYRIIIGTNNWRRARTDIYTVHWRPIKGIYNDLGSANLALEAFKEGRRVGEILSYDERWEDIND